MLTEGTRYFIGASRASHSKWSMPSLQPSLASLSQILPKLHDENILDDGDMHYMYDRAYGNVEFGKVKGMTPYYKLLNQLFCYTIAPTSGDADNISNLSKNLLASMVPNQGQFSIFDFIWEEIIVCSVSPKKGCHYAPNIFHMITEVTGVDILIDKGHQVYKQQGDSREASKGWITCDSPSTARPSKCSSSSSSSSSIKLTSAIYLSRPIQLSWPI